MRKLLRRMPEGVPLDTLVARIRGRRSFLVAEWDRLLLKPDPLAGLPPAPWRPTPVGADGAGPALRRERAWLFGWLTEPLRETMAPLFWLEEIRTLAISLRCLGRDRESARPLLRESLLAPPIRSLLDSAPDRITLVERLAGFLTPLLPDAASLPEVFRAGGCGAVESALYDRTLAQSVETAPDRTVRRYLALLVDSCNLRAVAKQLRWRQTVSPELLAGGSIAPNVLTSLCKRRDVTAIARLAAGLGGGRGEGHPDEIEQTVHAAQGRFLRRLCREGGGIATIIDYLWRCGTEARNLSLLARQASAGTGLIEAEIRG